MGLESADRMVKPAQQLALFCVNSKRQGLEIKSTERLLHLHRNCHRQCLERVGQSWEEGGQGESQL